MGDAPLASKGRTKAHYRQLALLKALVAFGGEAVSQEALADALWPDADGEAARRSFDTTLHRLRHWLDVPDLLVLADGKLSLNRQLCWSDVQALRRLLKQTEAALNAGQARQAQRLWFQARYLYQDELLAPEGEAEWLATPRHRLSRYFQRIARRVEAVG